MGAGPSLAKFVKSMEDEELASILQEAYQSDPQRIDRIIATVKLRHHEETGEHPDREEDSVEASAAALSVALTAAASASSPVLGESVQHQVASADSVHQRGIELVTVSVPETVAMQGVQDPMNALGTFEGHELRRLQPSDKNPSGIQLLEQNGDNAAASETVSAPRVRETDADGYPVLYGSCGRGKQYARCSVCYFRGLRCNTAHYCACCQRPVCIRPRTYPGENNPKICWNVLHMDKDMIQRVEKKKKRKLQALTAPVTSGRVKRSETEQHDRPGESIDETTVDIQRVPALVADVSGAIDL